MKVIEGGVTTAKGFSAAAIAAHIKYEGRTDMAMIFSKEPCHAAGVFTSNVVKAAPVLWDKKIVDSGKDVHAVVVNSGIANACTGEEGMEACRETAGAAASALGIETEEVLVSSTGVIGMQLPVDKMKDGAAKLASLLENTEEAGTAAAKAIMTTDTVDKHMAVTFELDGKTCTMGAMSKGSGMIHPNMCTTLNFVTTDAAISHELLQKALSTVVVDTFNMISVDGDTSTNDTLMVMANGLADNPEITEENEEYGIFVEALEIICREMAKKLAGDGEGATALFETYVYHVDTKEHARTLAKSVICSSLTKAAIFGHDANWGRILCALGYAGVEFDPDRIELFVKSSAGEILIFANGKAADYSEEEATKILSQPHVTAVVDMHMEGGKEEATAWGCDLSYDYVKINADYRS